LFEEDSPPEELLAGRRALEALDEVTLLEDFQWRALPDEGGAWVLLCRLALKVEPSAQIPASTDWYVLVDPTYPWGRIRFYPAKEGGIAQTFQHQSRNDPGAETVPWRTGDPCLDSTVRALGRQAFDPEPFGIHERLRWRFERALAWLEAAACGKLVLSGEPFELPQFSPTTGSLDLTVVFNEGTDTLPEWNGTAETEGLVDLRLRGKQKSILVVERFRSAGENVLLVPRWGKALTDGTGDPHLGAWIRLKETPILDPWKAPVTWGELRQACGSQGLNLDRLLRKVSRHLRDGKRHAMLLGFPVPDRVGDSPHRMHWQALLLPVLSQGQQTVPGFRANEMGYRQRDRRDVLPDPAPVDWLSSENWHPEDISTRGRLSKGVTSKSILLIGAGALGSAVGELLARAGASSITILDGDRLEVGNLARHTLGLDDMHELKANALTERLNLASPHATIMGISSRFQLIDTENRQAIQRCEIILDCTGDDAILRELNVFPWKDEKLFVSISLGFGAKRLFCFVASGTRFPTAAYRERVDPWIERETDLYVEDELPREGAGCWHPVFPARTDDVWMMAAAAVKVVESAASERPPKPQLIVLEQRGEERVFNGLVRVGPSPD
jgi:hypothetical protein